MLIWFVLFLDVITIEKTGEFFRLIYDVKGRFTIHRITAEEAKVSSVNLFSVGPVLQTVSKICCNIANTAHFSIVS